MIQFGGTSQVNQVGTIKLKEHNPCLQEILLLSFLSESVVPFPSNEPTLLVPVNGKKGSHGTLLLIHP